ncbi:N-acetylmuramoyl-L-alanine amidase [Nonomuraea sp. NPDC050790]|uniref:N-acetylmuramoyl-L-alanine amidase n=1 Tax=Nonomuraea sp. NPDC050790 TaxID=3364371 RepID=UPI0037A6A314
MKITSRADWNARTSRPVYSVPWSARTEFFVHHTDGPRSQTVRSIQDFHMGPSRGWSDVGYNFLVDEDGRIFEGRGWLVVGAHCPDHNRSGIGVAFIGKNNPTAEAKRAIRWLYDEACRRAGRKLKKLGHGDRYATECPGRILQAWVDDGMPVDDAEEPTLSWTEELVKDLPLLKPGQTSYHVKTLRSLLFARGALSQERYGGPHGLKGWLELTKYDADLVEDVKAFQRSAKLDADGLVGEKTWTAALKVA